MELCHFRVKSGIKDMFCDSTFLKKLFYIALPVTIQNLIISALNMIDTLMIGMVGETEIAAVGIANQYFILFHIIIMGMMSGCGIFISQFWGKQDVKNIRRVLGIQVVFGCIASIILTMIALLIPEKIISIFNNDPLVLKLGSDYLRIVCISYVSTAITISFACASRCVQNALLPMVVTIFSLLCNAFLNYAFIFGNFGAPALGVKGAALATLIARIIEALMMLGLIYFRRDVLAAKPREMLDFTLDYVKRIVGTVTTVILNELCWGIGFIVYSVVYGRIGTQAIASVQICSNVENLFMVIAFGMANASSVMIGNKIGEDELKMGEIYGKRLAIISFFAGVCMGICLFLSSGWILSLFNVSDKVAMYSLKILRITCIMLPIRMLNIVMIVGILRGGGDTGYSLRLEASTMWGIGVPLAFIGAFLFKLPVYYVVALVTLEEFTKCGFGIARLLSNKWINNVISDL